MTHEEIERYIKGILDKAYSELMDDVTQANRISVIAKIYHELYSTPEEDLLWLNEEELKEMILTVYYALSRQRHSITNGVSKEVKRYVKASYRDWKLLEEISGEM